MTSDFLQNKGTTFFQNLEVSVANRLGVSQLKSGYQAIRNERGWLDNQKDIEYIWTVVIDRCFVGWGGLFFIKYNYCKYREIENREELIKGLFLFDSTGIMKHYSECETENFTDPVANAHKFNLFDAGKAVTLDGIWYRFHIVSANIDSVIEMNNPHNEEWGNWAKTVDEIGRHLAYNSKNNKMTKLFR